MSFNKACRQVVFAFLFQDKIVVGHALFNDLKVLRLQQFVPHDMIRDTSTYEPLKDMAKITDRSTASLKSLSKALLGIFHATYLAGAHGNDMMHSVNFKYFTHCQDCHCCKFLVCCRDVVLR